jgi:hypothetical protein
MTELAHVSELDRIVVQPGYKRPVNTQCWALCRRTKNKRWHVRRIVWGRLLAREEKREGETIVRAAILLKEKP